MYDRKWLLKRYLNRYNAAKKRIENLESLKYTIISEFGEPQYGSGNKYEIRGQSGGISSGAAALSFRKANVEDRITEQEQQLSLILVTIFDILEYLDPTSEGRQLLEMKYLTNSKEKDILKSLAISRTKCYELLSSTLDKLLSFERINKIINEYEKELLKYDYSESNN